ncbi:MAG: M56 family metallopeptidase, partial [Acidobacteriota bacterium]
MTHLELAALIVGKGSLWLLGALAVHRLAGARTSAAHRHLWLAAAIAGLLVLPVARAALPPVNLAWLPPAASLGLDAPSGASVRAPGPIDPNGAAATEAGGFGAWAGVESPGRDQSSAGGWSRGAWLAWLWFGTSGFLLARWVRDHLELRRIARGARAFVPSTGARPALDGLALELGSTRLAVHPRVHSPCTFGALRPTVLLPPSAATWPAGPLRDVLVHELAHVERRDWLTEQVARVICALFFFQPLVWRVASRMAREAELACDDRVIRSGAAAADYAERLVAFARASHTPGAALAMAGPSDLSRRIAALLDPHIRRKAMTRLTFSLILLLTGGLVLAVA